MPKLPGTSEAMNFTIQCEYCKKARPHYCFDRASV